MAVVTYHEGGFPPAALDWPRLVPLIGLANAAVGRFRGVLQGIPNADVLLSPLSAQEAVLSSKIEGTQATLTEVLEFELAPEAATGEEHDDIREVLNYRRALWQAVADLKRLPMAQRIVKSAHGVLMEGVRGRNRAPGEFRRGPNWIGPPGSTMETARYIPPGANRIYDLIGAWERYWHGKALDRLVQLAILHAEFEAIHPFLDGNGRIGRLLVPLFLVEKELLTNPVFYMSDCLEARREEYYERLLAVSRDGDWTGWCSFFLTALIDQARANADKATAILKLYQAKKDWITDKTHSQFAVRALDWFFSNPVFKTSTFVGSVDIPKPTANRIIRVVRDEGLLRELRPGKGRRAAILAFPELFQIVEERHVFVPSDAS